jgi:chondroitin sulfate proteoglycan 4
MRGRVGLFFPPILAFACFIIRAPREPKVIIINQFFPPILGAMVACNNRCPYSPHSHISSLLSSGPAGSADLYIGSPTDFSGQDNAIYRLPLPSSASSSAGSSATPQHIKGRLRTMQYNAKWLNVPDFVGSVEADNFVYFFFREAAVEFSNCGKAVYSRVARVCKNDLGGGQLMLKDTWTTFLKARLNCSLPAEYPFYYDHIQSVTFLEEERLFYATFTTSEYVDWVFMFLLAVDSNRHRLNISSNFPLS